MQHSLDFWAFPGIIRPMVCVCSFLARASVLPRAAAVVALASLLVLAGAFTAQYAFGVAPCEFCLWQRWPYALAFLWGILSLGIAPRHLRAAHWMMLFAALTFLVGLGLGVVHSGVERHWWTVDSGCALHVTPATNEPGLSAAERLLATPVVPCDEIRQSFLGLTFANINVLISLLLVLVAGRAALVAPPPLNAVPSTCCCRCKAPPPL